MRSDMFLKTSLFTACLMLALSSFAGAQTERPHSKAKKLALQQRRATLEKRTAAEAAAEQERRAQYKRDAQAGLTPAKQYAELLKEYQSLSSGLRRAKTDFQRKAAVEALRGFSLRFLALAEEYPDDPVALTTLKQAVQTSATTDSAATITWETNRSEFPSGGVDGSASKIVDLILREYVLSDKIGPLLDRMRYGYRVEYESALGAVLEKNPHRKIRALACLAQAQYLADRLRMLRLVSDRPELEKRYALLFGEKYLSELGDLGRLEGRIGRLFELAASNEYHDVEFRTGTVGEVAKSELYDIRHLSVGKLAPEIEGKDQDGTPFKLSDYGGKVVLLYFWNEY